MDGSVNYSLMLRCHTCGQRQRIRRSYRDHLLWSHHEVARRGVDVPVQLEGRELEAVWAGIRRSQAAGTALAAAHRREQLGLPRVSDREAARRQQDNRARSARRFRAAARARGAATAALGTPVVSLAPPPPVRPLMSTRLGTFQGRPLATPAGTVRHGGARMPRPPCTRCLTCPCQTHRDFSEAQQPAYLAYPSTDASTRPTPHAQARTVSPTSTSTRT